MVLHFFVYLNKIKTMKELIKKYHCPECDEDLSLINSERITDVTETDREDRPLNGSYIIGVVTCTKCGIKSVSYKWWSSYQGYLKIEQLLSS